VLAAKAPASDKRVRRDGRKDIAKPVSDNQSRVAKPSVQQAQKERSYPTVRAPRSGRYAVAVPATDIIPDSQQSTQTLESERGTDEVMGEDQSGEQARENLAGLEQAEKPLKIKLSKLLRSKMRPFEVMERMLNQNIPVTVQELITLSPSLQKLWFGHFADPNFQAPPAAHIDKLSALSAERAEEEETEVEEALYTAACPRVKCVVGGKEFVVLLDSGAEVNVMSSDICMRLGLPMNENVSLNMMGATGQSKKFLGICESVEVDIGGVKHRVPIWVLDQLDQTIILGRPFAHSSRLWIQNKEDGTTVCKVFSPDGANSVSFRAAQATAPENRRRDGFRKGKTLKAEFES
jgi:hypothetical protein